ncbi:hypothetical protein MMC25_000707 [Agyrium rufum]|nr:hypothetical protein [Agyrium rufum]
MSQIEKPADNPFDSPLRIYQMRLILVEFADTHPLGHMSGRPRTPAQQASSDAAKAHILRTMTAAQINEAYEARAAQLREVVEKDKKRNEEIDKEIEILKKQHEMEKRVFEKMREASGKGKKAATAEADSAEG